MRGVRMVKPNRDRQSGRGLLGFLFCFALLGFTVLAGTRLVPVYTENLKIKFSLLELKHDGDLLNKNNAEIVDFLRRNWDRNQVSTVTPEQVHIERYPHGLAIELTYDVVKPMAGNIDTVLHFHDGFEITAP